MVGVPTQEQLDNVKQNLVQWDEDAHRVTPVSDFYLNISKGLVPGHTIMSKFGQNDDIGTGAYEDIWDGGG